MICNIIIDITQNYPELSGAACENNDTQRIIKLCASESSSRVKVCTLNISLIDWLIDSQPGESTAFELPHLLLTPVCYSLLNGPHKSASFCVKSIAFFLSMIINWVLICFYMFWLRLLKMFLVLELLV